jgi:L-amino acid N-acyltransferase YncA
MKGQTVTVRDWSALFLSLFSLHTPAKEECRIEQWMDVHPHPGGRTLDHSAPHSTFIHTTRPQDGTQLKLLTSSSTDARSYSWPCRWRCPTSPCKRVFWSSCSSRRWWVEGGGSCG